MPNIADEFMEVWNVTASASGWIPCRKMTKMRQQALRLRMTDEFWADNWREALTKAGPIPGLRGANERGWKASVDWFLRPQTVVKIMEGMYDAWRPKTTAPVLPRTSEEERKQRRAEAERPIEVVPNLAEAFKRPGVSPMKPAE